MTQAAETKVCARCGRVIEQRALVCQYCGAATPVAAAWPVDVPGPRRGEPTDRDPGAPSAPLPPPPQVAEAVSPPVRRGRGATVAFWVVGIFLLAIGGLGFVAANVAGNHNDKTYATQLTELHGDLTGSAAKAAGLRARTNAVAAAMAAYDSALGQLTSAHNAMVDGFNRAVDQVNATGSVTIAGNELPAIISRYQKAVADQKAKQAALAAAVTRLREVTR